MIISSKKAIHTDYYGIGSGLRVVFNVQRNNDFLRKKMLSGVSVSHFLVHATFVIRIKILMKGFQSKVITHRNYEWPTTGYFVPISNSVSIALKPSLYGTSDNLRSYSTNERQCLFQV